MTMTPREWLDREIRAGRLPARPSAETIAVVADIVALAQQHQREDRQLQLHDRRERARAQRRRRLREQV